MYYVFHGGSTWRTFFDLSKCTTKFVALCLNYSPSLLQRSYASGTFEALAILAMLMIPSMHPLVEDFPALLGSRDGINTTSDPNLHNHHVLILCESCGPSAHLLLLARLFMEFIIKERLAGNVNKGSSCGACVS